MAINYANSWVEICNRALGRLGKGRISDLTTGGDLVFWGTPEGYLKAADAKTGKVLWQFQTGSGIVAPPITWTQDGEQYVSVVSGWGGAVPLWGGEVAKKVNLLEQGCSVWTFKLPRK